MNKPPEMCLPAIRKCPILWASLVDNPTASHVPDAKTPETMKMKKKGKRGIDRNEGFSVPG
jgi:hypothetical protein